MSEIPAANIITNRSGTENFPAQNGTLLKILEEESNV